MFYLYDKSRNKIVRTKGKIIVFDNIEQAIWFKQQFIQYSMTRMMRENLFGIGEVMALDSTLQPQELTAQSGIKEEDTINLNI